MIVLRKSREKSRREHDETMGEINQLEEENQELIKNIEKLKQEYEQLQDLFQKHTGISLDQLMTSQTESNSLQPKSIEQPKEIPSKPVLTIKYE